MTAWNEKELLSVGQNLTKLPLSAYAQESTSVEWGELLGAVTW